MRRLVSFSLLLAAGLLAGCDLRERFSSAEERINAAMPLSLEVRQARERLLEQLAEKSSERAAIETTWAARLRLRAVSCSHGLLISWRQSSEEIRSAIHDRSCFTSFDQQLTRWLTLQRVRNLLDAPIVASPAQAASAALSLSLPSSDTRPVKDLGLAPVLALAGMNALELVALDSGRSILKERTHRSVVTSVSPNGRLFADFVADTMLRVRATESGETLLELPEANGIFWLGTQYLAVRSTRHNKPSYVIDLRTGEDLTLPLKEIMPGIQILSVPGNEMRLNVLSYRSIQQFEIQLAEGRTSIVPVAEMSAGNGLRLNPDNLRLSAGGKEWVMTREGLVLVDPVSLEIRETSFAPINLVSASPTAVAQQYVVQLRANGSNAGNGNYIYDARQETLARVQGVPGEQTLHYFPAVNRYALTGLQLIELLGTLDTAAPRPAADVISAMLDESNQLRLKQAEDEMRRVLQSAAISPDSPLLARMQAAQVEGLGVYEGREKVGAPGLSRPVGTVSVTVRRSSRPLVLVLSSYEAVQWKLRLEPGTRLEAILLSGYYDSSVVGGGDVRVLKIGREYAYQSEGGDYQLLQRQVTRWTGRPISIFQGGYYGGSFIVGGS